MLIKGKRTKRQRPISQLSLNMATSSSSTAEVSGGGFGSVSDISVCSSDHLALVLLPPSSGGFTTTTDYEDEEEDMANCLMLLAKGKTQKPSEPPAGTRSNVYQCKTCNRCFPSFQALGGHRASHKKSSKTAILEENGLQVSDDHGTNLSLHSRIHECSICGAEFTSGQALGGHMRRHRPMPNHDQDSLKAKKSRNLLSLDLNLPAAPEDDDDDHREYSKFSLVISASPLVDCHN
ncbi:C2H2-type zinc finger family protein [Forsythia ovata]|uniref:C2H2-type zinc finger family protein n=1 Tax=Forsythia ovata TaxID=205694 RepID=A0ABD1T8Q9_9LAMI